MKSFVGSKNCRQKSATTTRLFHETRSICNVVFFPFYMQRKVEFKYNRIYFQIYLRVCFTKHQAQRRVEFKYNQIYLRICFTKNSDAMESGSPFMLIHFISHQHIYIYS